MNPRRTRAVVIRVLRELRRDPRTVAMLFGIPPLLLWLVEAIFSNSPGIFGHVGPMMLGLFPFTMMFVVTSITVLRERTTGTLDRLMVSPIGRGELMLGYAIAFSLVSLFQAAITLTTGLLLLGMPNAGALWLTVTLVVVQALLGINLGLFLSAFARTEFQAVQFLPAVVLPQFFLAGLLVPVERLPRVLGLVARVLPLTYAFDALGRVMQRGLDLGDGRLRLDLVVLLATLAALLALGSLTLRRTEA